MKTVKIQQLSVEKFHRYGTYAKMVDPASDATGPKDAQIVFYRDMVQQTLSDSPSFSTCFIALLPQYSLKLNQGNSAVLKVCNLDFCFYVR
jgi:hypothetical protein